MSGISCACVRLNEHPFSKTLVAESLSHQPGLANPCVAEDVKVGKWTSFPRSVKLKPNETVIFSWIVYKSRAHRDRVNAKVMKDPRLAKMMDPRAMPFDGKRMIFGGFKLLISS